jgi:hypothetical protein
MLEFDGKAALKGRGFKPKISDETRCSFLFQWLFGEPRSNYGKIGQSKLLF